MRNFNKWILFSSKLVLFELTKLYKIYFNCVGSFTYLFDIADNGGHSKAVKVEARRMWETYSLIEKSTLHNLWDNFSSIETRSCIRLALMFVSSSRLLNYINELPGGQVLRGSEFRACKLWRKKRQWGGQIATEACGGKVLGELFPFCSSRRKRISALILAWLKGRAESNKRRDWIDGRFNLAITHGRTGVRFIYLWKEIARGIYVQNISRINAKYSTRLIAQ